MSNITDTTLGSVENIAIHYRQQLFDILEESIMDMQPYSVDVTAEFPNGDSYKYAELGDVGYMTDVDELNGVGSTGFEIATDSFSITEFKGIGHEFTRKQVEDGFWTQRKLDSLQAKDMEAAQKQLLASFLNLQADQTASSYNLYNGIPHRWVALGGSSTTRKLSLQDIERVKLSMVKANYNGPIIGLIDPVQAKHITSTLIHSTQLAYDPMWEGKIRDGMLGLGGSYMGTIDGVQLIQTNRLPTGLAAETIDSVSTAAGGTANIFFATDPNMTPFMHGWRRKWDVRDNEVANTDGERRKVSLTGRWGTKLFRPQGLVTVLTSSDYND